ncbi:hypothetical protein BH20VER2_BH20VER2_08450 [soil metagenome]
MNTTEQAPQTQPQQTPRRRFSAEAMIGTGISVAAIGVLFLLLGLAQMMRQVPGAGVAFLLLGAICVVIGVLTAMTGRRK